MTNPVTIKCSLRPIKLKFVALPVMRKGGKYFQLQMKGSEFRGQRFEVSSRVCAYTPESGLVEFFSELAAHRAGWEGVKHWASPRYGLSLASWIDDDLGQVALGVAFWISKGEVEEQIGRRITDLEWLEIVKEPVEQKALFVAASQLEEIAAGVREFFERLEESEDPAGELELELILEEMPDSLDGI